MSDEELSDHLEAWGSEHKSTLLPTKSKLGLIIDPPPVALPPRNILRIYQVTNLVPQRQSFLHIDNLTEHCIYSFYVMICC